MEAVLSLPEDIHKAQRQCLKHHLLLDPRQFRNQCHHHPHRVEEDTLAPLLHPVVDIRSLEVVTSKDISCAIGLSSGK
ncbi:unnamed protein product [Cylicostephanus goldi]|uniref:Uncharacterized protein n=1 Tax=Cylicostephanus goldi TaxID=71465 RepID=A0A3P7N758_CYLGO|nr:unnamed protein product [Cylicostephanus goldi]